MSALRRILTATLLVSVSIGLANAATVGPTTTTTPVSATLTDWTRSLSFPQFNPALGTLVSVELKFNGSLTTTLTVTNTDALTASSGSANTELNVTVQDAGNNFTDVPEITALSPPFAYTLVAGATTTSGLLTRSGNSDDTYSTAPVLAEFTGVGNITLPASTHTLAVLSNGGGNTNASQVTNASLTGTVTYTYTPGVPDLQVVKSHTATSLAPGGTVTYIITPNNTLGTAATTGTVSMADTLPAGLTAVSFAGTTTGWGTCTIAPTISCSSNGLFIPLPAGATGAQTLTLVATINPGVAAGTILTNTVVVAGGGETNLGNDTATDPLTVAGVPDLQVVKTHTATSLAPGGTVTYTITPNNTLGTAATTGTVTMTDTLPAGLTAVSFAGTTTGWGTCTIAPTISCSSNGAFTSMAAGATGTQTLTLVATINPGATAGAVLTNTAIVGGGGETNVGNDTATDPLTVAGGPDLQVVKTHTATSLSPGGTVTYTITPNNTLGTAVTTGTVTMTDTLPAGLTAASFAGTTTGWGTCTIAPSISCSSNGAFTALAAGATGTQTLTLVATINPGATAGAVLTNTAVVGGGGETNLGNDTATDPLTVAGVPDLQVVKSHTATSLAPGGTVTYTITPNNTLGTAATTGTVTMTDTLPAGLTAVSFAGTTSGWGTCTIAPTISCSSNGAFTALAAGATGTQTLTLVATINPGATAGAVLTNTVVVGGGGETNLGNDTATDPLTVAGVPDLQVVKSHTATSLAPGGTVTYTITPNNTLGTAATTGTVTMTDTLPAGLTAVSFAGTTSGWGTCTIAPTISCSSNGAFTALAAGATGTQTLTLVATINPGAIAGAILTNTAVVGGGGETNLGNDTATDPLTVAGVPDLQVVKTHTVTSLAPGGTVTYTITPNNTLGTAATTGTVTMTDTLPAGLTAVSFAGTTTGWGTCTIAPTISCSSNGAFTPIAAGATGTQTLKLVATINGGVSAGTVLTNTAVVGGGGETNLGNDTTTDPLTVVAPPVVPIPDLTITKSHTGNFTAGQIGATYTLTVSNVLSTPTTSTVSVVDTLPAGLTATAISGTGWSCAVGSLSCFRNDSLAGNASYPPITVTVNVSNTASGVLINQAVVSGGGETNTSNDTAVDPTTIVGLPDMTITKTHTGTSFVPGGSVTFTLTANNIGTAATTGAVTVTDTLPTGLTATAISGPAPWVCQALPALSCSRGDTLAAGASYSPITVTAAIAANATGTLVNNAQVSGGGEVNLTNDTATDSIPLSGIPDMTIAKTHTGTSFAPGGSVTFTLTANNIGTAATTGAVTVTDTLPTGLTATAISGPSPWVCQALPALSCSRGDALATGSSYSPITVTATIGANVTGTLVNNAQVSGGGEVNLTNDTATDSIAVGGIPDMTITKTHTGTAFTPGGSVTFTLTASNIGTVASSGTVTVTDTLPAGLTATAISGASPWVCQPLPALSCSRSDALAINGSYSPITVTAGIAATATGVLVNNAQVSGGGEVNLTNDKATDSITVTGACNPTLVKTYSGNFLPGGSGAYSLVLSNTGNAPTFGSNSITDPMPQGLTATAISGTGWICNLSPVPSCTRSDTLAPGASFPPITINVAIASNAPSSILNVATAKCDCDPNPVSPINAQAAIQLSVDLSTFRITKTADQTQAQIGDLIGYTVKVTNGSTAQFTNAQVQDTEPAGFRYVAGSAQLSTGNGALQAITPITTTPGILIFPLGTLAAQQTDTITYRLQVGGNAHVGVNINTVQATGTQPNGGPAGTAPATAAVTIDAGLFSTRQFLIGRVFEDSNGNGDFDPGERPVAGARVYLSNGGSATTDANGLYNIPVVVAGSVVVALDPATVPKGYTLSSGDRLDAQSWSRLVRTPLNEGMMLRQNFGLKPCPFCKATPPVPGTTGPAPALSSRPAAKLEVIPLQPTLPGDGRTSMQVRVRVLDDQGNLTKAKEVRIRTSAGQFVNEGTSNGANPKALGSGTPVAPATNGSQAALLGKNTELQGGRSLEQVPGTMQAGVARSVEGEATFLLVAAHTPGEARLVAESGDPDHLLSAEGEVWFTPEKRSPILVSDGEVSVGRAAPEFPILGQSGQVSRRADVFLQTPLSDGYLMTLGYTSHLTLNDSNGNPGLFQMDPLNRVYEVYGDSSTQYQAAQSDAHAYGRLEHNQSYLLFGDLRMSSAPVDGAPTPGSSAFAPQQGAPQQISSNVGDYNRNVVGAAVHLEDAHHDFITVEGARPNTSFSRDVFPGSTFGLIQLSHINILPGSESGVLETRDVHNPEILLSREQLVRSVDYSIDPYTGAVFFLRTLNAYDMALNLNQVVFTYEYQNLGGTSTLYGVRAQLRADSFGFKLGLGVTEQRDTVAGTYFLGDATLQQRLAGAGRLSLEVPVSHGSALSAGVTNGTSTDVNGVAIRGDVDQPFGFLSGRFRGSFSKTDANFFNPFGATVIPGAQTTRGSVELKPVKKTSFRFGVTDERNKTSLVNNQRQTGSFEIKQFLTGKLSLLAGYDYRDFRDTFNATQVKSNEVAAGLEWKPFERFTASVRREENLTASDPTYPNETLLSAHYQASETVRLFATERLASAPITPIGDLSTTGFSALAGKNETSIGIEDKWSKYTTLQSKYMVEDGINGTDTFAVIGLVNRIPVQEHFKLDLGLERGELLTGKDRSFDSGSVGFSWLPTKNFRASTRYEIRDLGGLGQIITTGAAGRLSDGLTILGRYQYSAAAFQPGTGAVDVLNPLATNSLLSQQASANQATAALAWRPWKTDREGILFSYTLRDATLNGLAAGTQPQHDSVGLVSTDAYYQATRRLELYGKFALSDRTYNYTGDAPVSTVTYLWQARAQERIGRRFDAAIEGRTIYQPGTGVNQWTAAVEGGFWVTKDLRAGIGYSFKSADEMAADFLTNPVKQGVYFVLTSKLSNMFNLFNPGTCTCAAQAALPPPPPPPAPKPVANIQISAITGAHDVCPSDDLRLQATASGWLPDQTPAYQWYIDGTAVPGATGKSLMVPTARGSGTRSVTVSVTAGGVTKTSAPVSVLVKPIGPPTVKFVVSPSAIAYGDKLPLAATGTASECTTPATITYTASEGSITGNVFDSAGVAFDVNAAKLQTKVIHLTATATDRIGQKATASGDVTITWTPKARRLDDVVFPADNARVNNCGKRLLLEELTPMLRNDPNARVILIGHRDTGEKAGSGKSGTIDEQRVLNAAAVLSAGQGICPQLDLSRILINTVGTEQASTPRPALCGQSVGISERPGQAVKASDARAEFRRVEIWFVPGGAELPAGMTDLKPAPEKEIKAIACPK